MRHISKVYSFVSVPVLAFFLFWGTSISAQSQSPADFFVGGANLYINGETERAKDYVDSGLSKFPDDRKLQALKKAIEEDKKDKNQDKENKQDQNKDQQNKNKDQQDQQQQEKNQDQQQQKDGNISKEDAQRLLDALANDEKNVQEKVKEAKAAKARVRTLINW